MQENKLEIVWRNVILMSILHLAGFYGFYLKFCETHVYSRIFGLIYTYLAALGVTAGRHRYFTHRSFKGNRLLDILFVTLSTLVYQESVYHWARDHRVHHKFSDTDADPYNSKRGFFFCHMGWFLTKKPKEVKEKGKLIDMSDLEANPIVMFEHKYSSVLATIGSVIVPTLIPWYFWNESINVSLFYVTIYRIILSLHFTWSVNSFAHMYGMRNYDKNIAPADNNFVSTLTLGEGFHNFHHTFPSDYKAAELGGSTFNFTTWFIDGLALIGMVKERITTSNEVIEKRKARTGESKWQPTYQNIRGFLYHVVMLYCIIF